MHVFYQQNKQWCCGNNCALDTKVRWKPTWALSNYKMSRSVFVCVWCILLFWGLEHLFGWFLQQSPLSPWSVSKNGSLQCRSGNHYSEIHCPFIRQSYNPIQSNPSTRDWTFPSTDVVHISGSTKLTTNAKAAILKKALSKTSPLHSHACLVTKLRSPYTKCWAWHIQRRN